MAKRSFGFELLRIADDVVSNLNSAIILLEESSKINHNNLDYNIAKFKVCVYKLKIGCALALDDSSKASEYIEPVLEDITMLLEDKCQMVWKHIVNVSNGINDILNITANPVFGNTPEENINVARKLFS